MSKPHPAAPASRAPDPSLRAWWSPVTVRVCWELLSSGVRPSPQVVSDARAHVLQSLPPGLPEGDVDWAASALTRDFLRRARGGVYEAVELVPWSRALWEVDVARLQEAAGPLGEVLYRVHYGDGLGLKQVAAQAAVDLSSLRAARAGLREIARALLGEQLDEALRWTDAHVDDALRYLSHRPEGGCPGPVGLLSEAGRAHADRCPRCSRAVRLVKGGVLAPDDLFPPAGDPAECRPTRLAALVLHPDARPHRGTVARALDGLAVEVSGPAWLFHTSDAETVRAALLGLARTGSPAREHLRCAAVEGPGRWRKHVVVGPLPLEALAAARARPWGELGPLGELPEALPPPPPVAWFWAVALVLLGLSIVAGRQVLGDPAPPALATLEAAFLELDAGWAVRFDADELARVTLLSERDGRIEVLAAEVGAGKAAWATGEGDYVVRIPGEAAAVLVTADDAPDALSLVAAVADSGRGLDALEASLVGIHEGLQLARSPVPDQHIVATGP